MTVYSKDCQTGRWRPLIWAPAAALATLLASCGGSGVSAPPAPGTELNDPSCFYQYTMPGSILPRIGPDPLFSSLWHLQNTGQDGGTPGEDIRALPAWSMNKGAGVRVALLDDGLEIFHEDLISNVVAGGSHDYGRNRYGFPLPCEIDDDHGTQVAGVLAAHDGNAVGVAGTAPRAGIVAFNVLTNPRVSNIANALTRDSQLNSIYSASWGSTDDGVLHRVDAAFADAIDLGTSSGRGGKGSIYVFATGNGGCFSMDANHVCQSDNPNFDGFLTHRGVNVVCAVDNHGLAPWWAESGANTLLCAPSSGNETEPLGYITTTAVNNGYTHQFSGTSSSTPMVAGVVALMLAANPNLSWRDVPLVLAHSARRNDPTDPGWSTNFGLNYNERYAFGVVNAEAAVALATSWTSVGTSATLRSCQPLGAGGRVVNIALPDATAGGVLSPRTDTVTVDGVSCTTPINKIEYVEVQFSATHPYSGDLRVELVSPSGLTSVLANSRGCSDSCGSYSTGWTFGSVRHLEEAALGSWTMRVTDEQNDDDGTWVSWNIRFWGR
ncbi:MAG: S8 family serine peptidase [Burkholderiaceae bacterium]|nr:S8 family serine peptidase [Burkholderiaceae bacterium]